MQVLLIGLSNIKCPGRTRMRGRGGGAGGEGEGAGGGGVGGRGKFCNTCQEIMKKNSAAYKHSRLQL